MAITKILSPAGWDWPTSVTSQVKLVDGRFGSSDRRDFIKRAGDAGTHLFEEQLKNIKFAKDEVPVHLIALGAKEAWGANRNGDAFTEATLKAAHDTFVKHAFWFRNHKNKPNDGDPKYGLVKASVYNPFMRRVELICSLPSTKAAAERMGVNVADQECEKLANNEDLPVSMACRVPYDICSGCQNKARTRDEYCKAATCKYGGCFDNLTKLVKVANDVHHLHVINPHPVFFDISKVWRPADRTAYAGQADWVKAAADGQFGIDGSKMAMELGVYAPNAILTEQDVATADTPELAAQIKLAYGLDELAMCPNSRGETATRMAFSSKVQPDLPLDKLGLLNPQREKVSEALCMLADRKIIMPLRDFARMTKRAELTEQAASRLPGVYYRMGNDGSLVRRLTNNQFAVAGKLASLAQREVADTLIPTHSLSKEAVDKRVQRAVIHRITIPDCDIAVKQAAVVDNANESEALARDYAAYKVAALHRITAFDDEFVLTARLATCQNRVI